MTLKSNIEQEKGVRYDLIGLTKTQLQIIEALLLGGAVWEGELGGIQYEMYTNIAGATQPENPVVVASQPSVTGARGNNILAYRPTSI